MQDLNIAIIQSDLIWEDIQANLDAFEAKLERLDNNADLIILPEAFNTGFPVDPEKFAETYEGKSVHWMRKRAKQFNAVITGSILISDNGKYYNMLIWMQPDGKFKTYAKRHVFHLGDEADTIEPGQHRLICELKGWKIKPLICYDLRFPVWSKNTFKNEEFEYDLLIYVANWPTPRRYPWKQLLIARAIENQAYAIGVNRIGTDGTGISYSGDSMIIDPKGHILADGGENQEVIMHYSLSATMITDFRKKFNVGYDWDQFQLL